MDYISVFIQMLHARGLADNTIRSYKTYILPYLDFLSGRSLLPEDASWQDMRDYLSFIQGQRGLSDRTVNMIISYLQFFQLYVLHKTWDRTQIPFRRFDVYLPFVPSRTLAADFIRSLDDRKARLAVSILFATGLRLDELCHLRCRDIYSSSRKIYVRRSKNHSDRYVPMPDSIWDGILSYWRSLPEDMRSREWLFTQQRSPDRHMDKQWLQDKIIRQRRRMKIDERLTAHSFRHAFATFSYENGMDLLTLKAIMGHNSIHSTVRYVHLAAISPQGIANPFEQIGGGLLV